MGQPCLHLYHILVIILSFLGRQHSFLIYTAKISGIKLWGKVTNLKEGPFSNSA